MALSSLRPLIAERFHEVQLFLSYITQHENQDPRESDAIEIQLLRGMFFVHLYAALEYAINKIIERTVQTINQNNVLHLHLSSPLQCVALDPIFTSLTSINDWSKRWQRRRELLDRITCKEPVEIHDTALSSGMQNIRYETIEVIFRIFAIREHPAHDLSATGYIKEVVEKRNAISHGRESPLLYGKMRSSELRTRYDFLFKEAIYILDCVDRYVAEKQFVSARHRRKY